ncbi:MAG: DUF192 domain-containing protein [Rhodanobacteraceae bacterium]|nr:MAG: DUF192 domain-containing protein [Rhodanobacteraceae bacterium]
MRHFSLFAAAIGLALCSTVAWTAVPATPAAASVVLHGREFTVEVATTPAEQAHGLMDRTSMPLDHGMLFVFPDSSPRTFWMKHTLIPLDMLFFDTNRRLVSIQADAKPCRSDPCALYPSRVPARYVLELNAGTAARLGLRDGDAITFSAGISGAQ